MVLLIRSESDGIGRSYRACSSLEHRMWGQEKNEGWVVNRDDVHHTSGPQPPVLGIRLKQLYEKCLGSLLKLYIPEPHTWKCWCIKPGEWPRNLFLTYFSSDSRRKWALWLLACTVRVPVGPYHQRVNVICGSVQRVRAQDGNYGYFWAVSSRVLVHFVFHISLYFKSIMRTSFL